MSIGPDATDPSHAEPLRYPGTQRVDHVPYMKVACVVSERHDEENEIVSAS